jgi:hypothetical protein
MRGMTETEYRHYMDDREDQWRREVLLLLRDIHEALGGPDARKRRMGREASEWQAANAARLARLPANRVCPGFNGTCLGRTGDKSPAAALCSKCSGAARRVSR